MVLVPVICPVTASRPWIRTSTLQLIYRRKLARQHSDGAAVLLLQREVRKAAKLDRQIWLEGMLGSGDWTAVRKLRKGSRKDGRLKDRFGEVVGSEARAETLAEYYERVQWAVRPVTVPAFQHVLGAELQVDEADIQWAELRDAAQQLKNNRVGQLV